MKRLFPIPIAAFLLALSACSSDEPKTEVIDDSVPQRIELSRSQQSMVGDQTQVTLDLYSSFAEKRLPNDDNCVFSPVSLEMWFAMIANGTSGATLQKILDAYGADNANSLNEFNMLLLSELPKLNPSKSKLIFANSLWENTLYGVNKPFKDAISSMFGADLFKHNFKDDKTKNDINKWVEKKTNGIIKGLLNDEVKLDAEKRMALINTVYFKAKWTHVIPEPIDEFEFYDKNMQKLCMTKYYGEYNNPPYAKDQYLQVMSKPLGNGAYEMIFMLPAEGMMPHEALANYTAESFNMLISSMSRCNVGYAFPKFKIASYVELGKYLDLGRLDKNDMLAIADYSGPGPEETVTHIAALEVNGQGVEGAAVTSNLDCTMPGGQYEEMIMQRPFAFMIRETSTGAILFFGDVTNPSAD